ncbi:uncharacterized protein LOC123689279 isoform X3 [Pieris rapae]|uniref:uncharacterized protein LOC123689279 isoform X3 n=1 Tax=Pieris rapae TaxID=64459 RepID=UPI001E27C325|nr:uncharacterized protein LOC123689279 isoform X3 [Pieris rapae]XP_045484629.1 uncharacterized protein LOC123689279 isoform X3 [Pieris rapae]XP_045484630.1 uncharacterized protein LOC123689279 isoform X3 [Pieris rapae]
MAAILHLCQAVGKLDSCMRGPYVVLATLSQDRYELKLVAGSYGKAAAEYMLPWRGEWTPDVCAAFFESGADDDDSPSPQPPHVIQESSAGQVSTCQPAYHHTGEDAPPSGEAE